MSYGRDRDAHTRGIGAIAAADHLRARRTRRLQVARAMAARDAQLSGLTYGPGGGLAGYGPMQALGTFKTFGTPMQNVRDPGVYRGGGPDAPPSKAPPKGPGLLPPRRPGVVITVPPFTPPPPRPTLPPTRVMTTSPGARPFGPLRPTRPTIGPTTGTATPGALCTRVQVAAGLCGQQVGGSGGSGGGSSGGSGGSSGGDDGAGAGIVTGGSAITPPIVPPPSDVPDVPDGPPDDSVNVAGYAVPKTAMVVGGALLAGYLIFRRKR